MRDSSKINYHASVPGNEGTVVCQLSSMAQRIEMHVYHEFAAHNILDIRTLLF